LSDRFALARGDCDILAHLVEFVKHFLQSFLNSFVQFVVFQTASRVGRQLLYDIIENSFCQELFSNSLNFLSFLLRSLKRSDIITDLSPFVKH
jgi:hypothetical protein